ncbi:MAG TPA: hypothetical protein VLK84_00010 [Longimicrobium sp.]|nr:hypothetical protein [Longimicrobium sp.]
MFDYIFFELVDRVLRNLGRLGIDSPSPYNESVQRGLDERIAMIDTARNNLLEGVRAIDELRTEAERNKRELAEGLEKLAQIRESKASLEQKQKAIAEIIQSDVTAFRNIAGIPTPSMIRRERLIGFFIGVTASVLASGIVWLIAWMFDTVQVR